MAFRLVLLFGTLALVTISNEAVAQEKFNLKDTGGISVVGKVFLQFRNFQ